MCLAIVRKPRVAVPEEYLRNGWEHNPDGAGYAFVENGKAVFRKGFMKYKEFLEAYQQDAANNPDSVFLIHFRITSQGAKNAANTHPFVIDGGLLIHNGTLSGTGSVSGTGDSDTCKFAEKYSKNLSFDFVTAYSAQFDEALRGSKLCMLYDDGRYKIVNEKDGVWVDDVWYSNYSFRAYTNFRNQYADWELET